MSDPEGAVPSRQSSSSTYEIPSQSSSTNYEEHDYYTQAEEQDLELSLSTHNLANLYGYSHNTPGSHALGDDMSPTSIYTTESEMPFDEQQSYDTRKEAKRAMKQQQQHQKESSSSESSTTNNHPKRNWKNTLPFRRKMNNLKVNTVPGSASATSSETRDSSHPDRQTNATHRTPIFGPWTYLTENLLHAAITNAVVWMATRAARNPYRTLASMTFVSLVVLATGFFTNFTLIVDSDEIYTPLHTLVEEHHDWLVHGVNGEGSGFDNIRPLLMILHKNGQNVLDAESFDRLFDAINVVRETPGYNDLCQEGQYVSYDNQHTCRILSATRFWNHNHTWFEEQVLHTSHRQDVLVDIISSDFYQDETTPVFHEMLLGNYQRTNETVAYNATTNSLSVTIDNSSRVSFVQSLFVRIELPNTGEEADDFETRTLDNLHKLQQQWKDDAADSNDPNPLQLDFLSIFAYKIENQRALIKDLPLVLGIFAVLVVFTTLVFHKRHRVYSRSMLGCASLAAIGMSLALSYGIVWCIGIPFTNIAQILPFMVMGVGLDDTFIITGAYFRTNPNLTVERRIEITMKEVGLSIALTSITTCVAFVLGSMSTIPGVKWLCWYAFSAIAVDFVFQTTFFVALLTLDERRLQSYRVSWCCWKKLPVDVDECESQMGVNLSSSMSNSGVDSVHGEEGIVTVHKPLAVDQEHDINDITKHFSERLMIWYGQQLMRPWCKLFVLLAFSGYFGFCCYRTTLLTQEFNVEDYTPADSYLRGTLQALDDHYSLTKPFEVYFRGVNQSDPDMQQQMRDYVNELAALPQIGEDAPFCWVRDFVELQDQIPNAKYLQNLTFNDQLRAALMNPTVREIYGSDIVINDETGDIEASRCLLFLRNVDLTNVNDQIDMLTGQREVTLRQPTNQGVQDLNFFSFDPIFFYWELYSQAVQELSVTILSGIVAVTLVSFVLIPHWSAALFVFPGIVIMYVNFLGTMQWMGLHINSLTYVIVVMAIGLLVDFLVHILLRYYETEGATRESKVKETMRTMGASMFVGGLTTFLGVCPLVFSSTHIFMTVFWAFAAMVSLGFAHGLILLPVVLSLVGPTATSKKFDSAFATTTFPGDLGNKRNTNQSSSPASTTSDNASKFDLQILESSSEEELEELNQSPEDEPAELSEKKPVPFLGPSYDLEMIEEGPNRPDSTTSKTSLQSVPLTPEHANASPKEILQEQPPDVAASLLGQLVEAYDCGTDFDFYKVVQSCNRPS